MVKSTDRTLEIISRGSSENRVVRSEPDNGLYDAMNKGLSWAKGDYIFFSEFRRLFFQIRTY